MLKGLRQRLGGRRAPARVPVNAPVCHVEVSQWYGPALAGPRTFEHAVAGAAPVRAALAILERLEPDDYAGFVARFYRAGLERFGDHWHYADINTVLLGLGAALKPETYLEIGVRRGRSLAMLSSVAPDCRFLGFDLWIADYAGMPNPGPGFVEQEVRRLGHRGPIEFVTGPSAETVPAYFEAHPDCFPDIVTVDGDHTAEGARLDLLSVMPRVRVGGALVFDDISNVSHPELRRVWNETVGADPRWAAWSFDEVGFGVAFAIRKHA
ncbi:MAG: class I SAM-dependent methyltransferase [Vicinamibacterales bacterium]